MGARLSKKMGLKLRPSLPLASLSLQMASAAPFGRWRSRTAKCRPFPTFSRRARNNATPEWTVVLLDLVDYRGLNIVATFGRFV
jgi:hypothetical protein